MPQLFKKKEQSDESNAGYPPQPDNEPHQTVESSPQFDTSPTPDAAGESFDTQKQELQEQTPVQERAVMNERSEPTNGEVVPNTEGHRPRKRPVLKQPAKRTSDDLTQQIEKIMEEGLVTAFKAMTPVQQQEFKMKGEETAGAIRQLLNKTHVKIKKVFELLLNWLKLLPGVSRFFLEQEAKIKADKILHLKHRHDQKGLPK